MISCAGRRNELVSYFRQLDDVTIHCCDMDKFAPSWETANYGHITPLFKSPDYIDRLYNICKDWQVDLLFSINDFELPLLAKHKEYLESTGTKVVVSDSEVIDICWDKKKTNTFLKANGFDIPKEYFDPSEITENSFPLIIKPRFGTASIGVETADNQAEFDTVYAYSKMKVAKSAISRNEVYGKDILIQQRVTGVEYAIDVINDLSGNYCGTIIKKKLGIRGGDASLVVTENNPRIEAFGQALSKALGHIGNLDCDIFVNDDAIYCVDLNPRFGGAYPFSHLSGINLPQCMVEWRKNPNFKPDLSFEDGIITVRTENYLRLENYKSILQENKS